MVVDIQELRLRLTSRGFVGPVLATPSVTGSAEESLYVSGSSSEHDMAVQRATDIGP